MTEELKITIDGDPWLTSLQIMAELGISYPSLAVWVAKGRIERKKILGVTVYRDNVSYNADVAVAVS